MSSDRTPNARPTNPAPDSQGGQNRKGATLDASAQEPPMNSNAKNDHNRDTVDENVQSQGGIGHKAASAVGESVNPHAGSPRGAVDMPGPSLDQGGSGRPHDNRAHQGLTGDDGRHQATDSRGTPASAQPGSGADLGAQGDQRRHAIPGDPAERVTGADTPNEGGTAGSPGGPKNAPERVPGQDRDSDASTGGSQSGNDPQRDQQI